MCRIEVVRGGEKEIQGDWLISLLHGVVKKMSDNGSRKYRRFAGYDYARGGAMFATVALADRRVRLFGQVDHEKMVCSRAGEIAVADFREACAKFAGKIRVHRWVLMPDHFHVRFSWPAGLMDPVKTIGAFIGRFKQMSQWHIAGRDPIIWEKNYVYASTFYSPGEHAVFRALVARSDACMIRLIPTFMDLAYRPQGDEPRLFAAKRLLVLSRMRDPEEPPRRGELLGLNDLCGRLAVASEGGKSVYVKLVNGRLTYMTGGSST